MRHLIILISLMTIIKANSSEDKKINSESVSEKLVYSEEHFQKKLSESILKLKKTSVADLTNEILVREQEVRKKEEQIKKREEELAFNLTEFETKMTDFEEQQKKILGCIAKNKDEEDNRVKKMVDVISNMAPAKAADLIAVQDPSVSIKILSKLENAKASKIFNFMEKEKSAQLQKQYLDMRK